METLTINVLDPKALKLIENLEALNLIHVVKSKSKDGSKKLSERLYGSLTDDDAEKIRIELNEMRGEWNRTI
jgi:hypothetical protein